jgi:hypothetical protein
MGSGFMTGFVTHFDTARDYTLQITITHTLVSKVTSTLPSLGSVFQRRMFPGLSYQLLTEQLTTTELSNSLTAIESELLYDWRFTANQLVLAPSPLRLTIRFFQLNPCGHSPYVKPSLTSGWVCLL